MFNFFVHSIEMFFLQFLPLCSQHVNGKLQGCMSVNVYVILWGSVTLLSYKYVLAFSPFTKAFQHILVNKHLYNCMTQYSIARRIVYCFALHTFLLMHYVYICMYVCLYVGIEQFLFKHSLFRPRNICVCVFFPNLSSPSKRIFLNLCVCRIWECVC